MTAEVAIFNKQAIALAADSAVTFTLNYGKRKIFQTANKIFSLSKYHPVGIMIYSNADFMSIPWETLIKNFRKKTGVNSCDTLNDYVIQFIEYLQETIDENSQSKFVEDYLLYYYFSIIREIKSEIENEIKLKTKISKTKIKGIKTEIISNRKKVWNDVEYCEGINSSFEQDIYQKYKKNFTKTIDIVFRDFELSKQNITDLIIIGKRILSRFSFKMTINSYSGIVIAGFGKDEIFPHLKSIVLKGVVNNKVIFNEGYSNYRNNVTSDVVPFAQGDVIDTFMQGMHPIYYEIINEHLYPIIKDISHFMIDNIPNLEKKQRKDLKFITDNYANFKIGEFDTNLRKYKVKKFVKPVMEVVKFLPKKELGDMAETLVNMTSFKKRISTDSETVGGPIDVAVISKGDGFVWIKRKHYFKPELNPQFFSNYNMEESNECEKG